MPKLRVAEDSVNVGLRPAGHWVSLRALSAWTPTINVLSRQIYDQAMITLPEALSVRSELQSMTGRKLELRYIEEAIQYGMLCKATIENLEAMCWRAIGQDGRKKKTEGAEQKLTTIFKNPVNAWIANGHVRKAMVELATAQRAFHVTLLEEFRPGRKRGTRSPAWQILSGIVRDLGPDNAKIASVVRALKVIAKAPPANRQRVECLDGATGRETFRFKVVGRRANDHNRRAIEDMLVELRKAPAPENISSEFR